MNMSNTCVIGDGGWGTALGLVLQRNGHRVRIWGPFPDYIDDIRQHGENRKFLEGIPLPPEIEWTADRAEAVRDADVVVIAVPSKFFREVVASFAEFIPPDCLVVSVTKGLDRNTHERMTTVASELLGGRTIAALSGPSHAEEVARKIPTAVVIASTDPAIAKALQEIFNGPAFRVYTSNDNIGVELGGALKNVVAIAVGISDGMGFGDNTRAALITRGMAEMSRLGTALGAHPATFAGLSGMGDLIVTCTSNLSRNHSVGERLGKGETVTDILGSMEQVAEGVWNAANAFALATKMGIDAPITNEVNAIVHAGKNPQDAMRDLLTRDPRPERDA